MNESYYEKREVKIIILGNTGVGKTCIINRFINNKFEPNSLSSIGSKSLEKVIKKDDTLFKLVIWDTSGEEKYHSLTNLFIKGSNIVILVYSVDNLSSFEGLDYWYNTLKEKIEINNYVLAIVGSKYDLVNNEEVSEEIGKKYAEEKNAFFKLVSAKADPDGIKALFDILLNKLIETMPDFDLSRRASFIVNKNKHKQKQKKCC